MSRSGYSLPVRVQSISPTAGPAGAMGRLLKGVEAGSLRWSSDYYNYEGAAALKPALEMMTHWQLRNFNDHDERACGPRRCWGQWGGI
jgi:hypothetical protein